MGAVPAFHFGRQKEGERQGDDEQKSAKQPPSNEAIAFFLSNRAGDDAKQHAGEKSDKEIFKDAHIKPLL
ncbi:MAG TPA: hypothetical protein VG347_11080 [Verrucomicrobiae bacterium]|nr:hypothetical protein [Verrucomicrobiae bacterium]